MKIKDFFNYIFYPTYRAMHRMNKEFYAFKLKMPGPMIGYPLKATKQWFIWYFNYQVLGDYKPEQILHSWKVHNTWVEMLSNPEFILNNLGHKHYTFKIHKDIWAKWEKLKQGYDKQLSDIEIPQN